MKSFIYYFSIAFIFFLIGWFVNVAINLPKIKTAKIAGSVPTPLSKYTIENLAKTYVNPTEIKIGKKISKSTKFDSYEFTFDFDPTLTSAPVKSVSGLINIPNTDSTFPVIIMFRGYVDPSIYKTGTGTQHAGEYFANNGFITIAPDFLGYGDSDQEAGDIFESRFQTFTTAVETIKSVSTLKKWDGKNIFIWGHSNGGQIALTTLEITGVNFPTVLWAPVSKPFPYSILYYTDDSTDGGKFLRHETSDFENVYDSNKFSLTNFLGNINAPILLNQGTNDEAVPIAWSDLLNKNLKSLNKDITYITYPGADHNLTPGWDLAVANSLSFFNKHLK